MRNEARRHWIDGVGFAGCVVSVLAAADTFELSFAGPDSLLGPRGSSQILSCVVTLTHDGTGPGAQAWQFDIRTDAAAITAITPKGTEARTLFPTVDFEYHELTQGAGNIGAISMVVLSNSGAAALPARSAVTVARIDVRAVIPPSDAAATLRYADDLVSAQKETVKPPPPGHSPLPARGVNAKSNFLSVVQRTPLIGRRPDRLGNLLLEISPCGGARQRVTCSGIASIEARNLTFHRARPLC
ncbi:MAG: hypothetical protein NTY65_08120 [Planctomycetota bacterium]|nr:hypothetical protein [Planctomycetota bacterium]